MEIEKFRVIRAIINALSILQPLRPVNYNGYNIWVRNNQAIKLTLTSLKKTFKNDQPEAKLILKTIQFKLPPAATIAPNR